MTPSEIQKIERELSAQLPGDYVAMMQAPESWLALIPGVRDLLMGEAMELLEFNLELRGPVGVMYAWPPHFVVFATDGSFGWYFFDTSISPASVGFASPGGEPKRVADSFTKWIELKMAERSGAKAGKVPGKRAGFSWWPKLFK